MLHQVLNRKLAEDLVDLVAAVSLDFLRTVGAHGLPSEIDGILGRDLCG